MEDDNQSDFVRDPDSVVNDQLLDNNMSDFDRELDEAIYASMQETNLSIRKQVEYEQLVLKDFENKKNERINEFKPFLTDLLRMSKFDKECKEIYDIIEPILDAYCNQIIETYNFDTITYERIFKVIGSVRTAKGCIDKLKEIINQE